jgi:hypothetical protein
MGACLAQSAEVVHSNLHLDLTKRHIAETRAPARFAPLTKPNCLTGKGFGRFVRILSLFRYGIVAALLFLSREAVNSGLYWFPR